MGGSDYRPDLDERKEVWRLLGHLAPPTRIAFLQHLCDTVSGGGVKTKVLESDGTVNDVWWGIQMLAFDRALNLCAVGEKLVRWVRRHGIQPGTKDRPVGHAVTPRPSGLVLPPACGSPV